MNICEHLSNTAKLVPEREALVFEGQRYSYAELDRLSVAAAKELAQAGIGGGERVALMLPNVPAFVVWYYAALRLGAVAVSISTRLAEKEVSFVLDDCGASALISDSQTMPQADTLPSCVRKSLVASECGRTCDDASLNVDGNEETTWVDAEPNEAALILYTSGTTGFAKGATLSHLNVRSNVHAFNHLCNMQQNDRILLAVPLFHCFGQNALLNSALNVGATLILQRKFDPGESKRLIGDERVSQLYGVPTMFQLLEDCCEPSDLSSVTYCFSAAAPLPIQLSRRWQDRFQMPINEGYGLTETSPFASYNHRLHFKAGSIGTPIDCVEMKIVDETGATCPLGELGEIAIRGPNVMLGYWNRPEDTADAIRDGWFHSGDIGKMDEQGYFYIVDRVKDMISVGGLKVFPAEVERVLRDQTFVQEVAVVGLANAVFGEQVVAFVVLSEAGEANDDGEVVAAIRDYAKENLANYKVPRQVMFLESLPRNPAGKVLKTRLREMDSKTLADALPASQESPFELPEPTLAKKLAATHAASRPAVVLEFVQELVKTVTGGDETAEPDTRFLDAGLDSLMIVEMSSRIQVEIGPQTEVPATLVFDHPRVSDLAAFLFDSLAPEDLTQENALASDDRTLPRVDLPAADDAALQDEIGSMSEEEALRELMKELEE